MIRLSAFIKFSQISQNRINLRFCVIIILIFSQRSLLFGQLNIPLNNEVMERLEPSLMRKDPNFFSFLKPYDQVKLKNEINLDSLLSFDSKERRKTWFGRKFLQESFLKVDSSEFTLKVDPLFNFVSGKEVGNNQQLIINTRGIRIQGSLGKTIGFESSLYENQAFFPMLTDSFINKRKIAPGQGRAKPYHKTGWDFAYSSASMGWRAGNHFYLQFATDKLFVGDGYRSLLLSDISSNYPFLRYTIDFKNFQYTRIIAELTDINYNTLNKDIGKFPAKTANFHLLSCNLLKSLQISIFEGTILKNPDNLGKLHVNYNLISPVPFLDMLNSDNSHTLIGLNLKWTVDKSFQVYNQWVFDNLAKKPQGYPSGTTNYGIQAGLKYFNVLKIRNLNLQFEFNLVKPNTYLQIDSTLAYTNFSQPLAHPLGENFAETIFILSYHYKRLFIEYNGEYAIYSKNEKVIFHQEEILLLGKNPEKNFLTSPLTKLTNQSAYISYKINPSTNSSINIGMNWRNEQSPSLNRASKYFYISFSTNLTNIYSDF